MPIEAVEKPNRTKNETRKRRTALRSSLRAPRKKRQRVHQKIYVLFHCDAWQSYESMRFIGVVTETFLDKTLRKIKKECGYSEEDMEKYIYVEETITNDFKDMNI